MCFRAQWSPLFYLVAVHHVNAFIFQRVNPEVSLPTNIPAIGCLFLITAIE